VGNSNGVFKTFCMRSRSNEWQKVRFQRDMPLPYKEEN
jgi:hypothetical protein